MAANTWYLTNNSVSAGSDLSASDPGAEAYRSPVTGWIVSTGATNHSEYYNDVERAAATFTGTTVPDGSLDTSNGDFWTSPIHVTAGNYASANWSIHFACRANTVGGAQDGRMRCRLFKGPNQDGSGATQITGAQQNGGLVTDLATGTTQVSTATFNPGAFSIAANEYVFVQLAWERTGAGGMTTSDVNVRIGHGSGNGSRVITSDFAATQSLTPSLVSNSNTFYAPTVSRGAVALTQSARFNNSSAFYAPTVTQSGPQTLTQASRLDNSNTFYVPTVSRGAVALTQGTRFNNSNAFYAPTVTRGAVALTQGTRFDNSAAFYAPTVTRGAVALTQGTRFNNSNAFHGPTVTQGALTLRPPLVSNSNTFYGPTITTGAVALTQASRFNNSNTFHAPTVSRGAVALTQGTRLDNSNTFYGPTVAPGTVTLTQAARFNNSNTIYAATVSQATPQTVTQTSRLDNAPVFYAPTLTVIALTFTGGNARIGISGDEIDLGRIGQASLDADVQIGDGSHDDSARIGGENAATLQSRVGMVVLRTSKGRIGP
jgi:hypothetical protein